MKSRLYSGRYSLAPRERARTVALHTPDVSVARKRLRDLIVEKQREAEGMIAPRIQREAARLPLVVLLADYLADLRGRGLKANHVKETVRRIQLIAQAQGWRSLADVTPASFVAFRAAQKAAAKTKKEYQTSLNAFLNWLVRLGSLAANPLAKVDRVDTRGKAVRPTRAFTEAELLALFSAAGPRSWFYRFLTYTGCRYSEAAGLTYADFAPEFRAVTIRAERSKARVARIVPLRAELRDYFLKRFGEVTSDAGVFVEVPTYEQLLGDLTCAGIDRKDSTGRVVHFHAFRKTFQTFGARAGVGQRSAQAILGHSDPSLTANVYTDEQALALGAEVAKLPWIDAQIHSLKRTNTHTFRPVSEIVRELIQTAKALPESGLCAVGAESRWLPGMDSNHD